ncbi:MAG TPA: DciA family protein, partial [Bacteroidia bacterium]|nr:DciA family protein [Bacteroidia bacterium]
MSKRTNDRPIKAAIEDMLQQFHLKEPMNKVQLLNSWERVMGPAVAHRTTEIMIIDRKLFVNLNSASLRQELVQNRDKITQL